MSTKNDPFSYPLFRSCPQYVFDETPARRRLHLALYTAVWSGGVIAGAVDFPHLTRRTPGGLIC